MYDRLNRKGKFGFVEQVQGCAFIQGHTTSAEAVSCESVETFFWMRQPGLRTAAQAESTGTSLPGVGRLRKGMGENEKE